MKKFHCFCNLNSKYYVKVKFYSYVLCIKVQYNTLTHLFHYVNLWILHFVCTYVRTYVRTWACVSLEFLFTIQTVFHNFRINVCMYSICISVEYLRICLSLNTHNFYNTWLTFPMPCSCSCIACVCIRLHMFAYNCCDNTCFFLLSFKDGD